MAIAVPDELQESVGSGTNRVVRALRAVRAVCGRSVAGPWNGDSVEKGMVLVNR